MSHKFFGVFLAAAGPLVLSVPLLAHHGPASFDMDKELTLKGTVTEWVWSNPHCFLKFDVRDERGTVTHWAKDPDPRWYGYSVGKWEDDYTFVVQTIGMDERTWLDNAGNPHSPDLRVEERYHRVNNDTLELTVTIDDPKAYTKPWMPRNKLPLKLMPSNTDLMEMICSPTEAAAYKKLVDTRRK